MGQRNPTEQRQQEHPDQVMVQPQAQSVLLVTDEAAALPGLERALAQRGVRGGVLAGAFLLKPTQAAGRSVASINPTDHDYQA
jgi:NADPH-dependent ferric siderophore reductase